MSARIVIAAGGTGGHIFPGLAAAQALAARGAQSLWLGMRGGLEEKVAAENKVEFFGVNFNGRLGKKNPRYWLSLTRAVAQARRALLRFSPQAALGLGGWASLPGALAALWRGVPLVIHEQNARAGRANRLLANWSKTTLCGFPNAFGGGNDSAPESDSICGVPVRDVFYQQPPPDVRFKNREGALRILVMGGSQGAKALNQFAAAAFATAAKNHGVAPESFCRVIHQCGAGGFLTAQAAYKNAGVRADIREFITEVAEEMAAADLVVARAGASTLAELAAVGCAAALLPYPFAADNHQEANARFFEKCGAAAVCAGGDEAARDSLAAFLTARARRADLQKMAVCASTLARPQAAQTIAAACLKEAGEAGHAA